MSFWPHQLNFAVWCTTTGCGVSREILFPSSLNLSQQIRSFYQFHVYYTTRKILYEIGGIQAYKRICGEFGIDPSTDFRFTYGQNNGLGYVNLWYSDHYFAHKDWKYPPADLSNKSSQRFSDEGGKDDAGNKIDFIRSDQGADKQFEYFVPNCSSGFTLKGLSRINQSVLAFGYCILGAQAYTRKSIVGGTGTAANTAHGWRSK